MKNEVRWAAVSPYQMPPDMRSDAQIAAEEAREEVASSHALD